VKKRKKKGKKKQTTIANDSTKAKEEAGKVQLSRPALQSEQSPMGNRFGKLELGALFSVAALILAAPSAFEQYEKTSPDADLTGGITDQSHPFDIPLVIKDQSVIFDFHNAEVFGDFAIVYKFPFGTVPMKGRDNEVHETQLITPSVPFFFISKVASTITIYKQDTGEQPEIEGGLLQITIKYGLSIFKIWNYPTEAVQFFTLIRQADGLHWIKGRKIPSHARSATQDSLGDALADP
jgi:hypothetical protein